MLKKGTGQRARAMVDADRQAVCNGVSRRQFERLPVIQGSSDEARRNGTFQLARVKPCD